MDYPAFKLFYLPRFSSSAAIFNFDWFLLPFGGFLFAYGFSPISSICAARFDFIVLALNITSAWLEAPPVSELSPSFYTLLSERKASDLRFFICRLPLCLIAICISFEVGEIGGDITILSSKGTFGSSNLDDLCPYTCFCYVFGLSFFAYFVFLLFGEMTPASFSISSIITSCLISKAYSYLLPVSLDTL